MRTPEFFYFDLGKVLLEFDHARMLRQMAEVAGVPVDILRTALMPSGDPAAGDSQYLLEAGSLSEEDYYAGLCERLGSTPARPDLDLAASDIFAPMEDSLRLVDRLRAAGRRLGLLSNTNPIHWRFFTDGRYPWLNESFEVLLGSFHVGAMKPDPAIYAAAVERAAAPAERVFFVDDKPENVEGAIAMGLDAVVFTGAADLERQLSLRSAF